MHLPFDPNFHEAVMQMHEPSYGHNIVCEVLQDGYTIHDRVIRPARVGVNANKGTDGAATCETASDSDEGFVGIPVRDA